MLNKKINDIFLFIWTFVGTSILFFTLPILLTTKKGETFSIYYLGKVLPEYTHLSLNKNQEYTITKQLLMNDKVVVLVYNQSVKIIYEVSAKNICQKQQAISHQGHALICAPNNLVIKIDGSFSAQGGINK